MSLSCAYNVSFSILYKISFLSSSTPLYSLVQWALSQVSFQFFYFLFSSHFFLRFLLDTRVTCNSTTIDHGAIIQAAQILEL